MHTEQLLKPFNYIVFDTLPSTQLWAKKHIDEFDKTSFTIVVAYKQSKGYGRRFTEWLSWEGNVAISICFFSSYKIQRLPLAQIIAQSVVATFPSIPLTMKYPNDIMFDNKKVGGVIVDVDFDKKSVIAGLGLNVNATNCLRKVDIPATSLALICNSNFDLKRVINRLVKRVAQDIYNIAINH